MKIIWCMVPETWSMTNRMLCHFRQFFALLQPKKWKFWKMKKCLEISLFYIYAPEIMIICYTVPEIWHVTKISVIFHFWLFFALLPPNLPKKWKLKKKEKKSLEISSFYTSVPKIIIICYTVPEIWHVTDVIVIFQFGLFFALLPP